MTAAAHPRDRCAAGRPGFTPHRLHKRQVPERWIVLDAVPTTAVGKLDKSALRERCAEGAMETLTGA